MKQIIAIVGKSGCGKDTSAAFLHKTYGYNIVPSYTTRPIREGEINGREHIFVDSFDKMTKCFAYAQYGGYEYWTTWSQFRDDIPNVYIVDEASLLKIEKSMQLINDTYKSLKEHDADHKSVELAEKMLFRLTKVTIIRDRITGVSRNRVIRDSCRPTLPNDYYDCVLYNVSLNGLYSQLRKMHKTLSTNNNSNMSIKGSVIHLLGGMTKQEYNKISKDELSFNHSEGRISVAAELLTLAKEMHGCPADIWCKQMYQAIKDIYMSRNSNSAYILKNEDEY